MPKEANRCKHKLLKLARDGEEYLINSNCNLMYELYIVMNITILYDYDRVFEKYLTNYVKSEFTALEMNNQMALIHRLLEHKSNKCISVFVKKYGYDLLLKEAVFLNNLKFSEYCLKNGASPNSTSFTEPLLFLANYEIFCLLIDFGADVDVKNFAGRTLCEKLFLTGGDINKSIKVLESGYKVPKHLLEENATYANTDRVTEVAKRMKLIE